MIKFLNHKALWSGPWSRRTTAITVLVGLVFIGLQTLRPALAQSPEDGKAVFDDNGCSACHSTGTDTVIGPGLQGVGERAATRTTLSAADYIRQSLADPAAFVVPGFAPIMPPFSGLSDTELDALIAYLNSLSGNTSAQAPAPPTPPLSSPPGDASVGENLFTGSRRFSEKGPPCSACHSSSGLGALGGGTLGPDLTGAFAKLGEGLVVFPETSPTMRPIFTERPLTIQEKADLLAFFRSADVSERDTQQAIELAGLALAGVAVIFLLTHLIWLRRLRNVRKTMVGR